MDRIYHPTTAAAPPAPDAHPTPGYPTEGDPIGGIEATVLTSWIVHSLIEEQRNIIADWGLTPAKALLTQMRQAIRRAVGGNVRVHTVGAVLTPDDAGPHLINIDANRLYQLPLANSAGGRPMRFTFIRLDQNAVNATITLGVGDSIDGLTTMQVPIGGRVDVISDGADGWHVMGGIGSRMQVFKANGTFTVPAGVYRILCSVWGGGGGGGGVGSGGGAASGGCGGGFDKRWFDVVPGQVLAVTVGAGGAFGNGTPTGGGPGGTTSIGSLISATGGAGGGSATGGSVAGVSGPAGVGIGGDLNLSGAPGNAGLSIGGTTLGSAGGASFCTPFVGAFANGPGNSAGFPGGGGGGAGGNAPQNGAAGAPGMAIIEW